MRGGLLARRHFGLAGVRRPAPRRPVSISIRPPQRRSCSCVECRSRRSATCARSGSVDCGRPTLCLSFIRRSSCAATRSHYRKRSGRWVTRKYQQAMTIGNTAGKHCWWPALPTFVCSATRFGIVKRPSVRKAYAIESGYGAPFAMAAAAASKEGQRGKT